MIHGIGIDLIEIDRLQTIVNRKPYFPQRILSESEFKKYNQISSPKRQIEFLAGRFAVKEAFSKALGTGIGKKVAFQDIHCENDANGRPYIQFEGFTVHVSISHTDHYATSQVVLEKA